MKKKIKLGLFLVFSQKKIENILDRYTIQTYKSLAMANIKSAKKRILQNQKRSNVNNLRLSRIRTGIKSFNTHLSKDGNNNLKKRFLELEAEISRASTKGFIKKNTASRMISKLSKKQNSK